MPLLLQLDGDLPDIFPDHERRLYIFACRRLTCWRKVGCVCTLRATRVLQGRDYPCPCASTTASELRPSSEGTASTKTLGDVLFGAHPSSASSLVMANPFSSSEKPARKLYPDSTAAESLRPNSVINGADKEVAQLASSLSQTLKQALTLNNITSSTERPAVLSEPAPSPELWTVDFSRHSTPYPALDISAAECECLDSTPVYPIQASVALDAGDDAISDNAHDAATMAVGPDVDSDFQKFAYRVAQNPEQVIRYDFGGTPLLCSQTDGVGKTFSGTGIPQCECCGAARVFEVQLMPHAIVVLEEAEGGPGLGGMEWCTIIVGVCSNDCQRPAAVAGNPSYFQEWTGVQWEEGSVTAAFGLMEKNRADTPIVGKTV